MWIILSERYGMTVARLKKSITYKHFRELWWHYRENVPPLYRLECSIASVVAMLYNVNRDREKSQPADVNDMLLKYGDGDAQQAMTVEETEALLRMAFGV